VEFLSALKFATHEKILQGVGRSPDAWLLEDAIWSTRRDTAYGIAVFDLDPGGADGRTSITMRYDHAAAPPPTLASRRPRPHAGSSTRL